MDNEKKVISMEQAAEADVSVETKPKFMSKEWRKQNRKKILIPVGVGLGILGLAIGKAIVDKKAEASAEEAQRTELAEEWFNRGLEEARSAPAIPESVDVEYTQTETVE